MTKALAALALACAALSAFAQTPSEPAPAAQPAERSASDRAPLKLKLDNPSSWATVAPDAEKQQPDGLPSLGDGVRPIPTTPSPTPARTSPYPSEPNPYR